MIVKARRRGAAIWQPSIGGWQRRFPDAERDDRDGLRLGWPDRWLHVRPSGTEPIVRLIAEAPTTAEAEALIERRRRELGRERPASADARRCTTRSNAQHVRNRRLCRTQAGHAHPDGRAAPHGVPRLRLRRHRGAQRRRHRDSQGGRQARRPGRRARAVTSREGTTRHRAHPLGDARRADHDQRPSAHRPVGPHRADPQRHHRELQQPSRRRCWRAGTSSTPRPTPRCWRT